MRQTLYKVDGTLVITVPDDFVERHGLIEGSQVECHVIGKTMTVEASSRPRYKLTDLLSEMPEGELPRLEDWENMPPVGKERVQ